MGENGEPAPSDWRIQHFEAARHILSLAPPPADARTPSAVWATALRSVAESIIASEAVLGVVAVRREGDEGGDGEDGGLGEE